MTINRETALALGVVAGFAITIIAIKMMVDDMFPTPSQKQTMAKVPNTNKVVFEMVFEPVN